MKGPSRQTVIKILSERTPISINGTTMFCKATLVSARGGKLVHYSDKTDTVVYTERYSASSFYREARKKHSIV